MRVVLVITTFFCAANLYYYRATGNIGHACAAILTGWATAILIRECINE